MKCNAVEKQYITQNFLKKMDAYWRAANYLGAALVLLLDSRYYASRRWSLQRKRSWTLGTVQDKTLYAFILNRVIKNMIRI